MILYFSFHRTSLSCLSSISFIYIFDAGIRPVDAIHITIVVVALKKKSLNKCSLCTEYLNEFYFGEPSRLFVSELCEFK